MNFCVMVYGLILYETGCKLIYVDLIYNILFYPPLKFFQLFVRCYNAPKPSSLFLNKIIFIIILSIL